MVSFYSHPRNLLFGTLATHSMPLRTGFTTARRTNRDNTVLTRHKASTIASAIRISTFAAAFTRAKVDPVDQRISGLHTKELFPFAKLLENDALAVHHRLSERTALKCKRTPRLHYTDLLRRNKR